VSPTEDLISVVLVARQRDQVPWNFAPGVSIPTLMASTDSDFTLPIDLAQKPMYEDLATPAEHKKLVIVSGGHIPFDQSLVIRETLDWLDRYLGVVETRGQVGR
jgi:hypothetical protein